MMRWRVLNGLWVRRMPQAWSPRVRSLGVLMTAPIPLWGYLIWVDTRGSVQPAATIPTADQRNRIGTSPLAAERPTNACATEEPEVPSPRAMFGTWRSTEICRTKCRNGKEGHSRRTPGCAVCSTSGLHPDIRLATGFRHNQHRPRCRRYTRRDRTKT